jgi:hypothetical protein
LQKLNALPQQLPAPWLLGWADTHKYFKEARTDYQSGLFFAI